MGRKMNITVLKDVAEMSSYEPHAILSVMLIVLVFVFFNLALPIFLKHSPVWKKSPITFLNQRR